MNSESRTRKSLKNIYGGMLFRIVGILFPFAVKMVMIRQLGVEYLGLNNLFSSVLKVLSLSELGVGSALVYHMYQPIAENDTERVCAILKVYRKFYRVIGCVILGAGICLLPALQYLIKGDCPADINAYILYLIYLVNTSLSYFLFAYKKSLWEANQCNGLENRLSAWINTGMYVVQILALLLTSNYYVYVFFLPASTLILNLVRNYMVDRMYPQYSCRGELEPDFIYEVFGKMRALLGHKIGTTVIVSADSIVISSMLGLTVLAIYGNYHQIVNSVIGIVNVLYIAITASVGNSIVTTDRERVYSNFCTLTFLNNWLVGWFSVCLLCLLQPFMTIWMGKDMLFPFHMVVLFVMYFYTWMARRIGLTYKDAGGMWEQDFWKPYIGAIVNLGTNVFLCRTIGVEGVLISTIVVMAAIYFPWETWVIFKKMFCRSVKDYLFRMLFYAAVTIFACLITYMICIFLPDGGIIWFFARMLICIFLPNGIFLIAYCRLPEFKDGKDRTKNLLFQR